MGLQRDYVLVENQTSVVDGWGCLDGAEASIPSENPKSSQLTLSINPLIRPISRHQYASSTERREGLTCPYDTLDTLLRILDNL